MDWLREQAVRLEQLPAWRHEVDRLRGLATKRLPRVLDGRTISDCSLSELRAKREEGRASNYHRARAWDPAKTDQPTTDGGNFHVQRYLQSLEQAADQRFRYRGAAGPVHELVRNGSGYLVTFPVTVPAATPLLGAQGSAVAAMSAGASWSPGGETAARYLRRWQGPTFKH